MLWGTAGSFVCVLAFGFSMNFWAAVTVRFFHGLLNGAPLASGLRFPIYRSCTYVYVIG